MKFFKGEKDYYIEIEEVGYDNWIYVHGSKDSIPLHTVELRGADLGFRRQKREKTYEPGSMARRVAEMLNASVTKTETPFLFMLLLNDKDMRLVCQDFIQCCVEKIRGKRTR